MVIPDKRRNFIVSTTLNYFGVDKTLDDRRYDDDDVLDKFLEEATCQRLWAIYDSDSESLEFSTSSSLYSSKYKYLVFFKIKEKRVSEDNFHDLVQVTSIVSKNSMTAALRQVWTPALPEREALILKKLERELLSGDNDFHQEVQLLQEEETRILEEANKRPRNRANYDNALMYLKNIRRELDQASLAREGLLMVQEVLDSVSGHLDDLWKLTDPVVYTEESTKRLLDMVGSHIGRSIKQLITSKSSSLALGRAKDDALLTGASICDQWLDMCGRMTGLFWPHNDSHRWKDKPYKPPKFEHFRTRLKDIGEIRSQKRQLTRLLTPSETSNLGIDALFESFDDFSDLLSCESADSPLDEMEDEWRKIREQLEGGLEPTEERVAAKLKAQLASTGVSVLNLETEFRRYSELIKRPYIKSKLKPERQSLLEAYPDLVALYQRPDDTATGRLLDTPEILQSVQAARVAELRLESLEKLGRQLLDDLPSYNDEVAAKLRVAREDAIKLRQELSETWVQQTRDAVLGNELSLDRNDNLLVTVDRRSDKMQVNFDPRLSTLIREARSLSSQGVELPREVRDLVDRAYNLTQRARALQQVANFYNTIGDRMILSQRPIMHSTSLELANAVKESSTSLSWSSNPRSIDAFTGRLRELVKKFARQNAELTTKHALLRDLLTNLLKGENNLATNQTAWKDTLRSMREVINSVEAKYAQSQHQSTRAWKLHWDRQLLKALGISYRAALPNLLGKLPEVRLELTYRDERLQWQPSIEDARTKIYSGIRRFVVIPANFRGVETSASPEERIFHVLIAQSAHLFGPVYAQAESLLRALDELRLKWLPLVAPAKLDIGQTLKGKEPQDWEKAFKDAKQWAQEVGKLRANEIRMSCVVVDTGTIRNDLESLSRRFWERLALDLRAEASSRLTTITEFLSSSSKKLSQRARTIEEVGEAFESYTSIQNQSKSIVQELEDVTGLGRVLAAWTRDKLDGLRNAHAAWDSLRERLDNYQGVMLHQLEEAKLNLRHQVLAVHDEQERWNAKWADRYKDGQGHLSKDWIEGMREKWTNLTEQRDSLISDCKRLNLPVEEIFSSDQKTVETMEAELEAEELNCKFQGEFEEELDRLQDEGWSVAKRRLHKIHEWLDSWNSRVSFNHQDNTSFIGRRISELREALEALNMLRSDELADEHWNELREILELHTRVKRASDVTLGQLLPKAGLIKANADKVKEVVKRAAAESGIRQALAELEAWESYTSLPVQEVRDSRNKVVRVVGDYSGLLSRAAELKMILDGARGAAGYERFTSRASHCESAITELEERLKVLSQVQRKWVYLEPVYASSAAPNDSGRWTRADKEFRYFMGEIARDPKIPSLKKLSFHSLLSLKDLMDRCQKSLDDFLEEKRSSYSRLYFLSDEDLLELVSGKGKGLNVHLSKLYQGVGSVEKSDEFITSVLSPEGEKLDLVEKVSLQEAFPLWLSSLERVLRDTLQQSLNTCLLEQTPEISSFPTQILLLCERIRFTEKCEVAMDRAGGLKSLLSYLENRRESLRKLEDSNDELRKLKAQNLLLETVHHIHIVRNLLSVLEDRGKLTWNWNRQIRTYKNGGGAIIRCGKAELSYRFEYQGAGVGLVRTPLTEKCYLALTQAMKLGLGGSPTGPAGTGKTESVKALGSILGRRVLVFNCDEGMDTGSMRRILSGLAQAGAWGCFDEFNRLEQSTMSAVAMLIRPLQEAIRSGSPKTQLGTQEISVDPNCCLFVTMNPAGNDYGGRRKLPDSLARLFRPIGMAHPNKTNIVQSLLECSGFGHASRLAQQCVQAFEAADKLLSKQAHYDWGLRALRSVLSAIPSTNASGRSEYSHQVARILVGIRESTMPKLIQKDALVFKSLLNDIFPNGSDPKDADAGTKDSLRSALVSLGLEDASVVERCLQLSDQLKTRSGAAIVGPPGSGKSLIIKTLADALSKVRESQLKQFHVYPGAITKSKLLGSVDPQTREFKEGLISKIISNYSDKPLWIVFDGDVDPEWAEALNSVLDDNKILTLPNGVGIKLGNETRFIFETHKLTGASPATVSRLGIVYLGSVSPDTVIKSSSFIKDNSTTTNFIRSQLGPVVDEALNKVIKADKSAPGLLTAALAHLVNAQTQTNCAYGLLLSLCGQINDPSSRDDLARYIYKVADLWCPDSHDPYDVYYDKNKDALDPFLLEARVLKTDEGLVHLSGPIQRGIDAILPWTTSNQAVIIRGPSGCGKNSLLSAVLTMIKNESDESVSIIRGSSVYGSKDLLSRLKRSCIQLDSALGTRTYKPKNGSSLVLVMEDLHLAPNNLQELLRQLIQEGGFYEDDLEFAKVSVSVLCTGDESTKLHPRLDSLLATHYLADIKTKDLGDIVKLHLKESLKNFDQSIVTGWISKISSTVVEAFNEVSQLKDEGIRESWTPRDLIRWIGSLKYYPKPDKESFITNYLIDASRRLYRSKLSSKNQKRLEKTLTGRGSRDRNDEFYVSFGGPNNLGLTLSSEKLWRSELENAVTKCVREGDSSVPTTVTPYLLEIAAGVSWSLGCEQRGILLSGRPGAGRRSATKLVSAISSTKLIDSGPGKGKASLKNAVQSAGIDGESTILLLEEHNLREDELTTLTGAILHNGELLASLVSPEELTGLIAPLGDLATREEWNSGSLEMFFYHRLKKYLTIVIIVDDQDDDKTLVLRNSIKITGQYLGSEWWTSEESLTEVATAWIKREQLEAEDQETIKEMVRAHLSAPSYQRAPARFLALLDKWKDIRDNWLRDITRKLKTLQAGVDKLKEAGERVAKLEEDATKQRQELEIEKSRAKAALDKIAETMRGATGKRGEMASLKVDTEKESAELAARKLEIEAELAKVEPMVAQAAQAVAGISTEALSEVRSLRAPPAPVRDILEGVLRLMGIRDTSWHSMKTFLAKRGVKDEIRNWDARSSLLNPGSLEAVARLVQERAESFEERTAKRASLAAAPLAAWVLANLQYARILQQVAPLEREQRILGERLASAEAQIGKLESGLSSVELKVAQLQEELAARSRAAAELQVRSEATETSLATARSLIEKLEVERSDWLAQLSALAERRLTLGIQAARAGCLLLYPRSSSEERPLELLVSERERLAWRSQGLGSDTESFAGASRILRANLVPLLVDPSGLGVEWLKTNLKASGGLEVTRPTEPRFATSVELAVRFGKALLVEELGSLPSLLLPLLRNKPLASVSGLSATRRQSSAGDVKGSAGFRLFLATRQEAVESLLPSEARATVSVVSLGTDAKSLAERLVDKAILQETPEAESKRREALEQEERLSGEMESARLELLEQLGSAQISGDSSGSLLDTLELTQSKAKEIQRALDSSRLELEDIKRRSEQHLKLANFTAFELYGIVRSYGNVSSLYNFTDDALTDIYLEVERSRGSKDKDNDDHDRLMKIMVKSTLDSCTKAVYRKHRLPLALHMAMSLTAGITNDQRSFLLSGESRALSTDSSDSYELPNYVPTELKPAVKALTSAFPELVKKMKPSWVSNIASVHAEENLGQFEKILIIRALHPEHLHTTLSKWAAQQLGMKNLTPSSWTLKEVSEENKKRPVLLLLSPGADPEPELSRLVSKKLVSANGFTEVSLGQDNVLQAERALEDACKQGSWILLSNLQLAINWHQRLETLLRSPLCTTLRNKKTRIWLSTEECQDFDPSLSGLCLKLAYEPPEGVKRNLKRSLQQLDHQLNPAKSLLIYWLHAILQERRKFVPQGWIKAYAWSEADLEAGCELVITHDKLSEEGNNWETDRGLLDVAVYGGLLQDEYDMRILRAILRHIWSKDVLNGRRKLGGGLLNIPKYSANPTALVDKLEDVDSVQVYFGLPANAHRAWEKSAAEIALKHLATLAVSSHEVSTISPSSVNYGGLRNSLREGIDQQEEKLSRVPNHEDEEPLKRLFSEEVSECRKVLRKLRSELDVGPLGKCRSSLKNLVPRVSSLLRLLKWDGKKVLRLDMSWFSKPDALLAALKLHTARSRNWDFDKLVLKADWTDESGGSVVIDNLLLTGARIEKGLLEEVTANASSAISAPACSISYVQNSGDEDEEDEDEEDKSRVIRVPLYSDSFKTRYICSLPVPYDHHAQSADLWHQRAITFHLSHYFID